MDTLILGLGNDFCGDDGVGIAVAERLRAEVSHCADIVISNESGLALLDYLLGYRRAIIIDAIHSAKNKPGTVMEMVMNDLSKVSNPSPHYTGLPELNSISKKLKLEFPIEVRILAIEASEIHEIRDSMSDSMRGAIGLAVERVKAILTDWDSRQMSDSLIKMNIQQARGD